MHGPRVVILNPFDPLWAEEQREGRYAYLARHLAESGFDVTWITSDWSHRRNRPRDRDAIHAAAEARGAQIVFVETIPYETNEAVRRLHSHARFAKDAVRVLEGLSPQVVIVSSPPPQMADGAVRAAHRAGAAAIVDVQDLWPTEFRRFWPRGLKWLNPLVFWRMEAAFRRACRDADARVAVAGAYLADAHRFGQTPRDLVVRLGVDLEAFDRAAERGSNLLAAHPGDLGHVLFWGGTISRDSDWPTVVDAVRLLNDEKPPVTLAVLGTGPGEAAMRHRCRQKGIERRVRFFGWQPHDAYAATLRQSAVALNTWVPGSTVAFPNRVFDYVAAGVPIVNSLTGEFADLVEAERVGLNCAAGSTDGLAEAVRRLLADDDLRLRMGRNARRLAERRLDRTQEYRRYIDLCEMLAAAT